MVYGAHDMPTYFMVSRNEKWEARCVNISDKSVTLGAKRSDGPELEVWEEKIMKARNDAHTTNCMPMCCVRAPELYCTIGTPRHAP